MQGQLPVSQVLVQWEGGTRLDVTQENAKELYKGFLEFNLRDKVALNGEGNVTCSNCNATKTYELAGESESIGRLDKRRVSQA